MAMYILASYIRSVRECGVAANENCGDDFFFTAEPVYETGGKSG